MNNTHSLTDNSVSMMNAQRLFRKLLSLVGKEVEIGTFSDGTPLRGCIANVMFDSIIFSTEREKRIVRFQDLVYVEPLG
jgi:hypothetical protein